MKVTPLIGALVLIGFVVQVSAVLADAPPSALLDVADEATQRQFRTRLCSWISTAGSSSLELPRPIRRG